jgi:hypothetical protein
VTGGDADGDRVVAHVRRTLGDPAGWTAPDDHTSVALAAIDSVWGIGVNFASVRKVLERYRAARRAAGADPESDGPAQLLALIDDAGGADGFAELVGNRQRTSTRNGVLKAEAVQRIAAVLDEAGLSTVAAVRAASDDALAGLRAAWSQVPGQRSGLSLDAFLMVCGRGGVKADRMVRRFVADALGTTETRVAEARAGALLISAAAACGVDARALDARVWEYQSSGR